MQEIKIFLASSNELLADREQFEIEIGRKNKLLHDQGVFLHLIIWEDFSACMSSTRSQDKYNEQVRSADLFVLLAYSKVGMYTEEEFEQAFGQFKETQKPFIFTYFKQPPPENAEQSLEKFHQKLKNLGHFYSTYSDHNHLWNQFNKEIDRLTKNDFKRNDWQNTIHIINQQGNAQYFEKIIGDVTIKYGEKKIKKHLTSTPFFPDVFLGREKELNDIQEGLFDKEQILILVNGQGGIGKTSVAARYYYRNQNHYAHMAWLYIESDFGQALLKLADNLDITFPEKATPAERLQKLLPELSSLKGPSLLIIDNANDSNDLKKYYIWLRSLPNFHVLLTSRVKDFQSANIYRINNLPEEKALELFKKYYPGFNKEDLPLFQQIRNAVDGNTLVIEILAKNLAALNGIKEKYSLSALWVDLQKKGLLLLTQSKIVSTTYHASDGTVREATPEEIIGAMYDIGQLAETERKLLSVLAVLPAENIPFAILEILLPEVEQLEETALALAQKGWTEYNEASGSFKCSPVVQEITREKNKQLADDCTPLISTLIDKLDYQPGTGHFENATYEEAAIFSRYAESVIFHIKKISYTLSILCERVGSYAATTGNLYKGLQYYEKGSSLAKKLLQQEPENEILKNGLAVSYQNLGNTWASLGDLQKARQFYEDQTILFKELYEAFPGNVSFKNGLAVSYSKLGQTWASLGDLQKARQFYEEYNQLEKELYEDFPGNVSFKNSLAISYEKLGYTWAAMGDLQKARQFYEDQTILFKELYEAFPGNVSFKNSLAISYLKLGQTWAAMGDLQKARQFYEDETILFKELYEAFPGNVSFKNGLAVSYEKLGQTWAAMGDLQKARQFYEDETILFKELYEAFPGNVSFKNGLAISYQCLGNTWAELGDLQKARQFYEEYNQLEKELYEAFPGNVSFKNGLAISYSKLGETWAALGDLQKARQFYEEYNQLKKELYEAFPGNVSFKNGLAISYSKLATFYRDLQPDNSKSKAYFEQCHRLLKELAETFPDYVAFQNNFNWVKKQMENL